MLVDWLKRRSDAEDRKTEGQTFLPPFCQPLSKTDAPCSPSAIAAAARAWERPGARGRLRLWPCLLAFAFALLLEGAAASDAAALAAAEAAAEAAVEGEAAAAAAALASRLARRRLG